MTDIAEVPPPAFLDNPHAPEIFADGISGCFLLNGTLRMALEAARVNHVTSPGPVNRVVICRLVMSAEAAEAMARGILAFLDDQRRMATGGGQMN